MSDKNFQDHLAKITRLIPTQIIGAYIVISGLIPQDAKSAKWVYLGVFVVLLILAPILGNKNRVKRKQAKLNSKQVMIVSISFILWVYCLGGPFKIWCPQYYQPWIGSVVVILWSLIASLVDKETDMPGPFVFIPGSNENQHA